MKIAKRSYIFIKGIPKKVLCLLLSYSFRYFWFLVLLLHFSKVSCKWIFFVIFSTENLLSFSSIQEILITNFCSRYCKNIHYIHYTQLTYRMRSKERNMANTLRNYYLKQSFLRRSSFPRTTGVVVGIRRFRNFPACHEKTKVVDLSGS